MAKGGAFFSKMGAWFGGIVQAIAPGPFAWNGATLALLVAALASSTAFAWFAFAPAGLVAFAVAAVAVPVASALAGGCVLVLLNIFRRMPFAFRWVLLAGVPLLAVSFLAIGYPDIMFVFLLVVVVGLLGAGFWSLLRDFKGATTLKKLIMIAGLVVGVAGLVVGAPWLLGEGPDRAPPVNAAALARASIAPVAMENPSLTGDYAVEKLFYGSGKDLRRTEFGPTVAFVTKSVNGSAFVSGWSALRSSYWGFDEEGMPLNARVWYPEGKGPFPLVLIVHGNHLMEAFSDTGYEYLGTLLASRGYIVASIDENFLNGSASGDLAGLSGLDEETDARGWLLLEHLKLFRGWNKDAKHPLRGKIDLASIALVGHSRGGEAIAVAAAFNGLARYPDDANVAFDYGFSIKALVAIAPVDGQYRPADARLAPRNADYLAIHGAHDMDVRSFDGRAFFERIEFTDGAFHFKAALYVYGANHGQFNTAWGRNDTLEPGMRLFDTRQLLSGEAQRKVAEVYVPAFLDASLKAKRGYLPLFRDYRAAKAQWLPDTIYLNQYADTDTKVVCDFDEDVSPSSTSRAGGRITGENLTVWREGMVPNKRGGSIATNAAYIGWDLPTKSEASYEISLPALALSSSSVLTFSLADAFETPRPDGLGKPWPGPGERDPVDFTIELVDSAGKVASLPLRRFSFLQPRIEGHILKLDWFDKPEDVSEPVFQTFEFVLADFVKENYAFKPSRLVKVRLVFDLSQSGVVVIDDIGFRGK